MRLQSPPIVSPDGQKIAFTATTTGALPRLYVRRLNALDAQAIARTDGAMKPFWSPDSRTLAYFAGGRLMKVAVDGGAPAEICATANLAGGAWGPNGVIVFSPGTIYSGLLRVSADGGTAEPVTLVDHTQRETAHRWPAFLPDGVHVLYFVRSLIDERRGVYVARIDRPAATPGAALFRSESEAVYASVDRNRGVLLNVADGHIEVRPFDTDRLVVTGDPATLNLPAGGNTPHDAAMLSVSDHVLTHVSSSIPYGQRLISSLRDGEDLQVHANRGIVSWPRLSPDGTRLLSQQLDPITGSPDLWIQNLERGTRIRVTEEGTSGQMPVWAPDGTRLAYVAGTLKKPVLTIAAADGTGVVSTLPCPRFRCEPSDWSRDGRWVLVTALDGEQTSEIWMVPTVAGDTARSILTRPFVARDARFSPEGDLIAYLSYESRRPEISVQTVDGTPAREVVSVGGGTQPVWRRNSAELLFVDLDGLLRSVAVQRTGVGRPIVGNATRVNVLPIGAGHSATQYDFVTRWPAGLLPGSAAGGAPEEIGIVLGWRELLK